MTHSHRMKKNALVFSTLVLLTGMAVEPASTAPYDLGMEALRSGDYNAASRIFRAFAQSEQPEAEFMLGALYAVGHGVAKDSAEAAQWYRKAAQHGDANAAFALAIMYAKGMGMPADSAKGAEWYRRAAEQGHALAQTGLAVRYMKGDGVDADPAIALRWFYRAAQQGVVEAQLALANMFASGNGVSKDMSLAYSWAAIAEANLKDAPPTRDAIRAGVARILAQAGASLTAEQIAQARSNSATWTPRPERTGAAPVQARAAQDGVVATLRVRQGEAIVDWHLTPASTTEVGEISGTVGGKTLGVPHLELDPAAGTTTAITVLLDRTDPERARQIEQDKLAISEISGLASQQHPFEIALYGDRLQILTAGTDGHADLAAALAAAPVTSTPAKLNSALDAAIALPSFVPVNRRAIFVMTDGHTDDRLDSARLIQAAERAATSIYFVIRSSGRQTDLAELGTIATSTGGRLVQESEIADFIKAPFRFVDGGGTVHFPLNQAHGNHWDPASEVRVKLDYGTGHLELAAKVPDEAGAERQAYEETLRRCDETCSAELKDKLRARLDLLATEEKAFIAAQYDPEGLRRYLTECRACSFRGEAAIRVSSIGEQRTYEVQAYEAARGDFDKLRFYVSSCIICADREDARQGIAWFERQRAIEVQADREKGQYQLASGDLSSLRQYVQNCEVCAYSTEARTRIAALERVENSFSFEVCNHSGRRVSVAVSGRPEPDSPTWAVNGWYNFAPGECSSIGRYAKGWIYYMAQQYGNSRYGWRGRDLKVCVRTKRFSRINHPGYKCSRAERLESFSGKYVSQPTFTWTLNP